MRLVVRVARNAAARPIQVTINLTLVHKASLTVRPCGLRAVLRRSALSERREIWDTQCTHGKAGLAIPQPVRPRSTSLSLGHRLLGVSGTPRMSNLRLPLPGCWLHPTPDGIKCRALRHPLLDGWH